jgi:ATP-dependent helicase HrpA
VPEIRYPEGLPVSERKDEILATIRDHQVVIVAGETGSGKSTQLPKICLELGRGVTGVIGHTQPRRLAARTVAERVAEELGGEIGDVVGYTVRFTDRAGDRTLVKLMTDGILLAELQRDRELTRYDTLIIDEAHERSLNIDFILGYLRQLLPRRPDLKVIVTSATIDTERFSEHFGDAPIVEVTGRTYPVEIRYRPLDPDGENGDGERDQTQAICDAVEELGREGPGDVLVFLSGEREIRDTAEAIDALRLRATEVLPLYARLSAAEQHRIFQPHPGRRIVLATNVAETSLTVPGVRYVVDAGTARISRYSRRTKVQRLPIEAVSRAAANQRAGRCGRVAPGICIRLYAEDDFEARPEFTEPEILRTNLASVILQMTSIGLGDVAAFPFVDPPDARNIKDGMLLLDELGALQDGRLTKIGRRLATIPLDPRLARMVVEAQANGCVREVMVIASALSIQDPRERPADKQAAADEQHRRFADPESDFLSMLHLWNYLREQQQDLSSNQFRRLCRREFLNHLRVREWQDIYSQVRQITGNLGIRANAADAPDPDRIHLSLLAGLLSQVGMRPEEAVRRGPQEYLGAHNARFAISPGSVLSKKPPRWVMAAEVVETTRLWARTVARIQPAWIERVGAHLVKRTYSEPTWSPERGAVMALERVTLHGLPVVTGRSVNYGRIDPALSRDLFIGHALVEGDWDTHHRFAAHNRDLIAEVRRLEDRVRRRDLLVDDGVLFDFFDERVGSDVVSARHFDSWWKRRSADEPHLLDFTMDLLIDPSARDLDLRGFPDTWRQGDLELRVSYEFAPGADLDGVTVHVPLAVLNQVRNDGFDWQVPALRRDLVAAVVRSLPKSLRRHFVPVTDSVRSFLESHGPGDGALLDVLAADLRARTGELIRPSDWDIERVPDELRINFRIEDERGRRVAFGKDLDAITHRLRTHLQGAITRAVGASVERAGATSWDFGDELPRVLEAERGGYPVRAFPALVDEGKSVGVQLFGTEDEQALAMRAGTRRLLLLGLPSPLASMQRLLKTPTKLALASSPEASLADLLEDCVAVALDALVDDAGGPAWDAAGFEALRGAVRGDLVDRSMDVALAVARVLAAWRDIGGRLDTITAPALLAARLDVRRQLARLVFRGFVPRTGAERLTDIDRYLRAIAHRLDRVGKDTARDTEWMRRVQPLEARFEALLARLPAGAWGPGLDEARWMLEELRVGLFAQSVGTPYRVSEERVRRVLDELDERM